MHLALITISERGIITADRIIRGYGDGIDLFLPQKFSEKEIIARFYSESLGELVRKLFNKYHEIAFIMAMGIVVRIIAPNIRDKHTDPAIVAIDDVGRYVISVLSGHEGGANNLAHRIANILHTEPIITTGSESYKDIIIGIGCKRNVSSKEVKDAIHASLDSLNLAIEQVRLISTIDIKADEKGLLDASKELNIPLRIVAREEIKCSSIDFEESEFVKEKIGIGAVCEPAALLGGRKTALILTKQKYPGITIAIAKENFMW